MIGKPSNDKSLWEQENKHNFMANNFFKPKTEKMLRKQLWISLINQLIHKFKKKIEKGENIASNTFDRDQKCITINISCQIFKKFQSTYFHMVIFFYLPVYMVFHLYNFSFLFTESKPRKI